MHVADENRYRNREFRKCGTSGLRLSPLSLGLWHNFGGVTTRENARELACTAFDLGITHFDLANNYGPPPGSAEETFGGILKNDLAPWRDEMVISTKAGYTMWPGPYGDHGSRKYLVASLDQSLRRMGLDYVDIYYHHRPDPDTPLEETMGALAHLVRQGKALYAGISNYPAPLAREAARMLRSMGTPLLIHQPRYSLFDRAVEEQGLFRVLAEEGAGAIAFSPLAQGLLTDRYLEGIPADSRAGGSAIFLRPEHITEEKLVKVRALRDLAADRGQTVSQLALAWVLRDQGTVTAPDGTARAVGVTSALIGASKAHQIRENVAAAENCRFTPEELRRIDTIMAG